MWPYTSADLTVEALINGTWTEITTVVRENTGITIKRGRGDERARLTSQTCNLVIDNSSGNYSNRNPNSPYFGKLGRNTQVRVRVADPIISDGTGNTSSTTSLVAPSVTTVTDDALLICLWLAGKFTTTFNITVPVSMTAGTEVDRNVSTSRSATEVLSAAGATGTRTATASAAADWWLAGSIAIPGTPTVEETLQSSSASSAITLTTGAGTEAGWWMIAVQIWAIDAENIDPYPPSGDGWVPMFATDVALTGRMRAWVKPVASAGAQAVTFAENGTIDHHAHLFVLSGMTGLPAQSAFRFWGEIPHWPQRWDRSGNDVTAPIVASGQLRRLTRPGAPLRSALFRAATSATSKPLLLGYWPLEDGTRASQFASGIGGNAMVYTGTAPTPANVEVFYGSAPLVQFGSDTRMSGDFTGTDTGTIAVRLLLSFPAGGTIADGTKLLHLNQTGGGSTRRWQIIYGTGGTLNLRALNSAGTVLDSTGAIGFNVNGTQVLLGFQLVEDGSDVDWNIFTRTIAAAGTVTEGGSTGTFTGLAVGTGERIVVGPAGGLTDLAVGHVMVGDSTSLAATLDDAIVGHIGETAGARLERLCEEEGISFTTVGYASDTEAMGPQGITTLGNLLFECRDADMGILYERRDAFGLAYRTRADMENQATKCTLTYGSGHVADLRPQDDDQYLANDVTLSRADGSSSRSVQETGPNNTSEPEDDPQGVGVYPLSDTVNVQTDSQVSDLASWLKHLGTWDETRWPLLETNLARLSSNTTLAAQVLGLELGDRMTVEHALTWIDPDDINVLGQGYMERITTSQLRLGWNTSPAAAYHIFRTAEASGDTHAFLGYLVPTTCVLAEDLDTSETSVDITTTTALWSTDADDWTPGALITVNGEDMLVTAVSGASNPQTLTVTRSVNGIVKTHTTGDAVEFADPGVLGA